MRRLDILYKRNTASQDDIFTHLLNSSESFTPPLIERVDIIKYSKKLFEKSVTFEAWNGRILVGLLAVYVPSSFDGAAFITNVSVLKEFMGLGISAELLSRCVLYVIAQGCSEISLEVHEDNIKAVNLYKKFEFLITQKNDSTYKMSLCLDI